jgi:hypothetical protein
MMMLKLAMVVVASLIFPKLVWGKCNTSIKISSQNIYLNLLNFTGDSYFVSHQEDEGQIQKFCVADNSTTVLTPVYDLGEGSCKMYFGTFSKSYQ